MDFWSKDNSAMDLKKLKQLIVRNHLNSTEKEMETMMNKHGDQISQLTHILANLIKAHRKHPTSHFEQALHLEQALNLLQDDCQVLDNEVRFNMNSILLTFSDSCHKHINEGKFLLVVKDLRMASFALKEELLKDYQAQAEKIATACTEISSSRLLKWDYSPLINLLRNSIQDQFEDRLQKLGNKIDYLAELCD